MWEEADLIAIEDLHEGEQRPKRRRRDGPKGRWDRAHMASVGTKLPRGIVREIKDYCYVQGTSPYTLLRQYLMTWLREQRKRYE